MALHRVLALKCRTHDLHPARTRGRQQQDVGWLSMRPLRFLHRCRARPARVSKASCPPHSLEMCFGIRGSTGVARVACVLVRIVLHAQTGRLQGILQANASNGGFMRLSLHSVCQTPVHAH
jgi:hypothetical protein